MGVLEVVEAARRELYDADNDDVINEIRTASRRDGVDDAEEEERDLNRRDREEGMMDERDAIPVSQDKTANMILDMATKMAALELDNARLQGLTHKRTQAEREEEEEEE